MSFKLSPEFALLGSLMAGPKHGYEVHGEFSSKMNQFWHLNMSQIYALLKRMEKNGMVVSREVRQENRPAKRIFFVTQEGKQRFQNWIHSPVRHVRDLRIEFMAKLFFVEELKAKGAHNLIDRQSEVLQERLGEIEGSKGKTTEGFQALVYSFRWPRSPLP